MRRKFFIKNFMTFIIPIFVPVLIFSILAISFFQKNLKNDIDNNTRTTLKMSKEIIDSIFLDMNFNKILIDSNPQLNLTLLQILKDNDSSYQNAMALKYIYPYLNATSNSKLYIHSIYIYMGDSEYFLANGDKRRVAGYADNIWYNSFKKQDTNINLWTEIRDIKNYSFDVENTPLMSMYMRIKHDGVLVINVQRNFFNNMLDSINTYANQAILVFNENNQIIFSNKYAQKLPQYLINQYILSNTNQRLDSFNIGKYHITQVPSVQYNFKYVSFIPNDIIYKTPNLIMKSTIIAAVISLLISSMLAYYFTKRNYNQISNIITTFDLAKQGKPLPNIVKKENDAYTLILNNVINTFINQSYIKVQLSERKFRLLSAQLSALQYQINPHFLFNTLQSINFEILNTTQKPTYANTMIEQLSDILRYSLDNPMSMVTIQEEINITKHYADIQKYRYGNKFDIIWEYDNEILACKTLRLILQPIIENSIYHGIREKDSFSLIKVKIKRYNNEVKYKIIDNGLGMSKEKLKKLVQSINSEFEFNNDNHIGLKNANKRIKLKYGEEYNIKIRSKPHLGTSVSLNIKYMI